MEDKNNERVHINRPVGGGVGVRGVRTNPPQTQNIDKMKQSVDKPERL